MKQLIISTGYGLAFFLFFFFGWGFGLDIGLRLGRLSSPAVVECTCAPCFPDKWCRKCGHRSRDCPKLSWYFKRRSGVSLTNRLDSVTNIVSIPLTIAPK